VNGKPVDIHMKIGEAGEAFFVVETDVSRACSLLQCFVFPMFFSFFFFLPFLSCLLICHNRTQSLLSLPFLAGGGPR